MKILEGMARGRFEQVVALNDSSCGLSGFLVIHDTTRGPAAGGIRIYPYRTEEDALADGFRLASAMTFKGAAADLPVGGGKIVLRENPDMNREEMLRAVGRFIQGQGGRFLAGRDVGVYPSRTEPGSVARPTSWSMKAKKAWVISTARLLSVSSLAPGPH